MFNINQEEKEILKKLFIYPFVLVLFSTILIVGLIYIIINNFEKQYMSKDIDFIIKAKKKYIKNKVLNLSSDVDKVIKLSEKKAKRDIKKRVDNVYFQLLSINNLPLNNKKETAIKYLNNLNRYLKNYIFAYDAASGVVYVHKIKKLIGKNTENIILNSGKSVYERNQEVLKKGGFYETYFYKSNDLKRKYLKVNYIKYVPEFNFIIGSGEYVDDMKKRLIKNTLERINLKRFDNKNYFFIVNPNGVLLIDPVLPDKVGKNVLNIQDEKGKYLMKDIISTAMLNKNGGFVKYYWIEPETKKEAQKISYVVYNKSLGVIIGAGLYYKKDVEDFIQKRKKILKKEFLYINIAIFFIAVIILIIAIGISFYLSKRLRNVFALYSDKLKDLVKKVEFEAKHDTLTKVPNRKYFNEKFKEEFYRAKRYKEPLSIAMVDIDHFKNVNDTYGHKAGDVVLQKLASFCNKNIRKSDFFARWGGEEFMFIFPHTNLENTLTICEKIKDELQNDENIQNPVKFTISCGITEFRENDTMDSLLKRADEALYMAKENGRDRIEVI